MRGKKKTAKILRGLADRIYREVICNRERAGLNEWEMREMVTARNIVSVLADRTENQTRMRLKETATEEKAAKVVPPNGEGFYQELRQ